MSSKIIAAIIGYFVPFTLFFVLIFSAEYFLELLFGLIAFLVGSDLRPDFPGPTNFIRLAISIFPDVWDLGTGIFYGSLGAATFFLYIIFAILDGLVVISVFIRLKDNIHGISHEAIARSAAKFGALASIATSSSDPTTSDPEFTPSDGDGLPVSADTSTTEVTE